MIIGTILQKIIQDNNFSALDPETAFQYVYSAFMESYASGGVCISATGNTSFTMEGGSIEKNTTNYRGGGEYLNGTSSFSMTDGTIEGNSASSVAGIYVGGILTFDGGITVTDDVKLATDQKIILTNQFSATESIPISMETPGVFTTGAAEGQLDLGQFYSVDTAYYVDSISSIPELELTKPTISLDYQDDATTDSTMNISQEYGGELESFSKLPTTSYSGYQFLGWYTASTGGEKCSGLGCHLGDGQRLIWRDI